VHAALALLLMTATTLPAEAGFDHRVTYDDSGIWARSNQQALVNGLIGAVAIGALWEGGESRLGKTFWQSVDSGVVSGVASTALKYAFSRERPSQTDDPHRWFTGNGQSFPSGEVTTVSSLVTPFVLEYREDSPAVYALELLPVYDAIARVKTWGHWQTDVIAGFALGTTAGYLFHQRSSPLILSVMPHGIQVGLKMKF
jgi:undecaprenyl-diphosphatase